MAYVHSLEDTPVPPRSDAGFNCIRKLASHTLGVARDYAKGEALADRGLLEEINDLATVSENTNVLMEARSGDTSSDDDWQHPTPSSPSSPDSSEPSPSRELPVERRLQIMCSQLKRSTERVVFAVHQHAAYAALAGRGEAEALRLEVSRQEAVSEFLKSSGRAPPSSQKTCPFWNDLRAHCSSQLERASQQHQQRQISETGAATAVPSFEETFAKFAKLLRLYLKYSTIPADVMLSLDEACQPCMHAI